MNTHECDVEITGHVFLVCVHLCGEFLDSLSFSEQARTNGTQMNTVKEFVELTGIVVGIYDIRLTGLI